jgi:hypothetical protein
MNVQLEGGFVLPISEYIIKQKCTGAVLIKKIALGVALAIAAALAFIAIISLAPPVFYIPFALIALALLGVIAFTGYKLLYVEYEIVIGNGELCASVIYGRSITKRLISLPIKQLSEIGSYDDAAYERLCSMGLNKNTLCISSLSAPVIYYALYEDEKDRCVIYFETYERGLSILKRDNPSAFRKNSKI